MRRPSTPRHPVMSGLESRRLLSGNVTVVMNGNTLTIKGDNSNDSIGIEQTVDSLHIWSFDGTKLNGITNGSLHFSNPSQTNIDLKGGNDQLTLKDYLGGGVSVQMGSGNDHVSMSAMTTDGNLLIDLNSGNDRLDAIAGGLLLADPNVVGGNFSTLGGSGNDTILISTLNVHRKLSIDAGNGNDDVGLGAGRTEETSSVLLGNGNDNAAVFDRTSVGLFSLNAGNGNDLVGMKSHVAQSHTVIDLGTGNDALLSEANSFNGNVTRAGGTGTDTLFSLNDTLFGNDTVTGFEFVAPNLTPINSLAQKLQELFGITF